MREQLLDQAATALLLGLRNERTLAAWRLRRQGPPYVKVGANVRYKLSDLESYIAANRVEPVAKS